MWRTRSLRREKSFRHPRPGQPNGRAGTERSSWHKSRRSMEYDWSYSVVKERGAVEGRKERRERGRRTTTRDVAVKYRDLRFSAKIVVGNSETE